MTLPHYQRFKHRIIGDDYSVTIFVKAWTYADVQTVQYDVSVWKSHLLILEKRVGTICEALEIASKFIL